MRSALVFVVLAGCGAEEDPCGNGTCDPGETSATCRMDCAQSFMCRNADCAPLHQCAPLNHSICIPAFTPGDFVIEIRSAAVPETRADGTAWDAGDPPDPYVVVKVRGVTIGITSTIADTIAPSWAEAFGPAVTLDSPAALDFEIVDEDGDVDDLVLACTPSSSDTFNTMLDTSRRALLVSCGPIAYRLELQ